ncbi:ankyrin 2,3/unc44 [Cavenderia fasciculata]|uniref:Ankyrin 2,3/unc44 n=1 Tax=Cavenderia fasciculata TaxID=261658 RepID=F4PP67_CACFS|nr:ankyrin 2,3/unc44 [Cavenderia fasciculata]EGG22180.1 ankyrin 2,3/unc44 [Cavenderia fasciculata]|eukprot:XP_004360031.1 ankyrin 2,3/unc44 [Cavenderia fasciculata]
MDYLFFIVFKNIYIRNKILIDCSISSISSSRIRGEEEEERKYVKGKILSQSLKSGRSSPSRFDAIGRFALPWSFVSHYLPQLGDQVDECHLSMSLHQYISHKNATIDTLAKLLDWVGNLFELNPLVLDDVAERGNEEMLQLLDDRFPDAVCSVKAMNKAAAGGHLGIVIYLHNYREEGCTTDAMDYAAANGWLQVVEFLHTHRSEGATNKAMTMAARNAHLNIVQYLFYNKCIRSSSGCGNDITLVTTEALKMASANGHLEVANWLETVGGKWTNKALTDSMMNGHLHILEYLNWDTKRLTEIFLKFFSSSSSEEDGINVNYFALEGHLKVLKYLVHKFKCSSISRHMMDKAAHLDVVTYLHETKSGGCTSDAMDWASKNGHIDIVKYLHFNRTEGATKNAMDWAAENGHLEVVQFLSKYRQEGCTKRALGNAAKNGHVEVVRYLDETYGIPEEGGGGEGGERYLENTLDECTSHGSLEIVRILHKKYSSYLKVTTRAMDHAAENGHIDIVMFLERNRTEGCSQAGLAQTAYNNHFQVFKYLAASYPKLLADSIEVCMSHAAFKGNLDMIQYIYSLGPKDTTLSIRALGVAAPNGHLKVVEWFHNNFQGEIINTRDFIRSANNGHLHIVKFLHLNRSEGCKPLAMSLASKKGYLPIVKFLNENRTEGDLKQSWREALQGGHLSTMQYLLDYSKTKTTSTDSNSCRIDKNDVEVDLIMPIMELGIVKILEFLHKNDLIPEMDTSRIPHPSIPFFKSKGYQFNGWVVSN